MEIILYQIRYNQTYIHYLVWLSAILIAYCCYLSGINILSTLQKAVFLILSIFFTITILFVNIAYIGIVGIWLIVSIPIMFVVYLSKYIIQGIKLDHIQKKLHNMYDTKISPIHERCQALNLEIPENQELYNDVISLSNDFINFMDEFINVDLTKTSLRGYKEVQKQISQFNSQYDKCLNRLCDLERKNY